MLCCSAHAADWRDAAFKGASTALLVIDWGQTREGAKHPDKYIESNPFLGSHPSLGKVNVYFATGIAINLFAVPLLPHRLAPMFHSGVIMLELKTVLGNRAIGVRMSF